MNKDIQDYAKKNEEIMKGYLKDLNITWEDYSLVNNYGFTFTYKGKNFDCRFWANNYGTAINEWMIGSWTMNNFEGRTSKDFQDFLDAYIERYLQ